MVITMVIGTRLFFDIITFEKYFYIAKCLTFGFIIIIIFIFGNENLKVNEMSLLLKHFKIRPFLECLCLSFP
jgi:hypothetical protein